MDEKERQNNRIATELICSLYGLGLADYAIWLPLTNYWRDNENR